MRGRIVVASLVASMFACASPRPATQVTVFVDAQPHVRGVATQLVVRVSGGHDGETFLDAGDPVVRNVPIAWPFDVTVTPSGDDASRLFEIEATAYDSGQRLVSQARLRGGFVRGESRHVTLTIEDACLGISCAAGLACRNGQCVPIGPSDPDAGVPDSGADAGPIHCTSSAACDDGNVCNGLETCVSGACVAGPRADCDDHVGCTDDSCDGHQCVHMPNAGLCTASSGGTCDATNDCQYGACTTANCVSTGCQTAQCNAAGTLCMRTFACAAGHTCCGDACVVAGCDDGLPCTTDHCSAGSCQHDVFTGPCDDHDVCTGDGTCAASGMCTPGPRMTCDDGNPCTNDSCDAATGCAHPASSAACDDDNPCTVGDTCAAGACMPGAPNTCDDHVGCTLDTCDRTTGCAHVATDSRCTAGTCDPVHDCQAVGGCNASNCVPDPTMCLTTASCMGTTCVRVSSCTPSQMCCGGVCVAAGCSDGNPCTDDACDGTACTHPPTTTTRGCDDMNACTTGDVCNPTTGACAGTAMSCDDANDCTDDVCAAGTCTHPANDGPCTSDNPCAFGGTCIGGYCNPDICGGFSSGEACCGGICMPTRDCGGGSF